MKVMEKKKKPTKTLACSHALAVDVSGVIGRQIRYAALPFDKEHILPSLTVWFGFLGGGLLLLLFCSVLLFWFFLKKVTSFGNGNITLSYHLRAWYVISPLEPLCHSSISF